MHTKGSSGVNQPALIMLLFMISSLVVPSVVAACECGYSSQVDALGAQFVYTDLLESDFLHIRDIALDTDWRRQTFNKTPAVGRGPYGMNFTVDNVISNSISDHSNWTGPGRLGGDPGLQIIVKGGIPSDGYVEIGQLDSVRTDMRWGSYRTSFKLPAANGTCAAFFWYFNDSQEIDMEFLSHQYDFEKKLFPVNLVLQTPLSASQGFSEKGPNNYVLANLAFDPTTAFHEYRIDFVPGKVVFFVDGEVLAIMNTTFTPSQSGHMTLSHWSNGNEYWSKGPPTEDATMLVAYVKAYFNTTDPERTKRYASSCVNPAVTSAVCMIDHQNRAPDPGVTVDNQSAAQVFFFTDNPALVKGQIFYEKSGVTVLKLSVSESLMYMILLSVFAAVFL